MKLFIDSADIDEIERAYALGVLDGVTTNPSLIKKAAKKHHVKDMKTYIKTILKAARGTPVSLEVIGTDYDALVSEGKKLYALFNGVAKNVVIKIPVNPSLNKEDTSSDGIRAIKTLSKIGIPVNCTLVFTPEQALLAAKAGARYVSPFAGRIDDHLRAHSGKKNFDKSAYYPAEGLEKNNITLEDSGVVSGVDLVAQCVEILEAYPKTEVLAASLRNARQFRECALVGSPIATVPLSVIISLLDHEKTMEGMKGFVKDIVPEYKTLFS